MQNLHHYIHRRHHSHTCLPSPPHSSSSCPHHTQHRKPWQCSYSSCTPSYSSYLRNSGSRICWGSRHLELKWNVLYNKGEAKLPCGIDHFIMFFLIPHLTKYCWLAVRGLGVPKTVFSPNMKI